MTRKEAIEVLTKFSISNFRSRSGKTYLAEALTMAIQALQNVPCKDAISRQAAIDAVNFHQDTYGDDPAGWIEHAIKELPSVHPTYITCRDCKYWRSLDGKPGVCTLHNMYTVDAYYCADAEVPE